MFTKTEYLLLGIIGFLWLLQIIYLFVFYNAVNRASRHNLPNKEKPRFPRQERKKTKKGTERVEDKNEELEIKVMAEAPSKDYDETVFHGSARQLSFFDNEEDDDEGQETITVETPSPEQPSFMKEAEPALQPEPQVAPGLWEENTKEMPASNTARNGFSEGKEETEEKAADDMPARKPISAEPLTPRKATEEPPRVQLMESTSGLPTLSVIIVTSNQDYLLQRNLPAILTQDYPDYEVIVVNDNSNDDTSDVLERFKQQYPHLRTTFTSDSARRISHKKLALTLGIKAAAGEWLVFTEPDCHPVSNQWLRQMAAPIIEGKPVDAVVGYTTIDKSEGFIPLLRQADNMLRGVRALCAALLHKGYMAYGTNLLYRRSLFFEHKGYSAHLDLERGEDDIFVAENISKPRIRAAIHPNATVVLDAPDSHSWMLEKTGRIFTRRFIRAVLPLLLTLETVTRALYAVGSLVIAILSAVKGWWALLGIVVLLWLLRLAGQFYVLKGTQQALGERNFIPYLPLLDFLLPFVSLYWLIRYAFSSKTTYQRKQL